MLIRVNFLIEKQTGSKDEKTISSKFPVCMIQVERWDTHVSRWIPGTLVHFFAQVEPILAFLKKDIFRINFLGFCQNPLFENSKTKSSMMVAGWTLNLNAAQASTGFFVSKKSPNLKPLYLG